MDLATGRTSAVWLEPTRIVRCLPPKLAPATVPGTPTSAPKARTAVNARDRIGAGPWHNARGDLIGNNVDEIHGLGHRFNTRSALDPEGRMIPDGGFTPNRHDILTGSMMDGMAYPAGEDMTCSNWTSGTTGKARVGHHDRANWLSAHDSRGCTQDQLRDSGGDGLFYCFAID